MKDAMKEYMSRESEKISGIYKKIICGNIDQDVVIEKFNELKSLGINIELNMKRSNIDYRSYPLKMTGTYKNRKTIVEYCLETKCTTRISQNGNLVYIKYHSIIQFMDYVKDLFLGKEK